MDKYINEGEIHLYLYNNNDDFNNDFNMVNWYGKYTCGSTSYRGTSVGTINVLKNNEIKSEFYSEYKSKTISDTDYPNCKYNIFFDFPILRYDSFNARAKSIDEIIKYAEPLLKINTPFDMYRLMSYNIYTGMGIDWYDDFCKTPEETIGLIPDVPHEKEELILYLKELEEVNKICKKNNVEFIWI